MFFRDQILTGELDSKQEIAGTSIHIQNILCFMINKIFTRKILLHIICFFNVEMLASFPSGLEAEDIEDFCALAQYYGSRTPQSFRRVNCNMFFKVPQE